MSARTVAGPLLVVLALLVCPAAARAQRVGAAPAPFVGNMLSAVALSLQGQPFYGSMLLNAFDFHLQQVVSRPNEAAAYLKAEIVGVGNAEVNAAKFAKTLGTRPIQEHKAAALLLANALARPEQFQQVVNGLETLKPGLGERLVASLGDAGSKPGATYQAAAALRKLSEKIKPVREGLTYGPTGEWATFFDGAPVLAQHGL